MKKHFLISISFFLFKIALAQTITVDGNAYLQEQTNHDSIKVVFNRVAPSALSDSTYTNSVGHYSMVIPTGTYNIMFSKRTYVPVTQSNVPLYNSTTQQDTMLEAHGLIGVLSGNLPVANYVVYGDISVAQNSSLTINPGTKFRFKTTFMFNINGLLDCQGTESDSIIFTRYNNIIKWRGIQFYNNNTANSIIKYCLVEYVDFYGINIINSKSPIISHSMVRYSGNMLGQNAGGITIRNNYNSTAYFDNIVLVNNVGWAGGGIYIGGNNTIISNALIMHNKSISNHGGGLYCEGGNTHLTISNSIIRNNINGGIALYTNSSYVSANFEIINTTIVNNNEIGLIFYGGNLNLANCIIANNSGFGIKNYNASPPSILNCNVFSNAGGNFNNCGSILGNIVTTNANGTPCDGFYNIMIAPNFADTANGDYSLLPNSPCIDAGLNDSVFFSTDILGNIRIWDGNNDSIATVDMGAYEFNSPHDSTYTNISKNINSTIFKIYPNPATTTLFIKNADKNAVAELYNLTGDKLITQKLNTTQSINISQLAKGIYLVRVTTDKEVFTEKIIKE